MSIVYQTHTLSAALVTESTAQSAVHCDSLIDKWVEVVGLSVGDIDIEISTDGSTWLVANSDVDGIAAAGWFEVPQPATHIRVNPNGATLTSVTLRGRPG